MTVYLVGAGPGDPRLLTRRGAGLLSRADVVIHDRLVHPALLALAPADAVLIDGGKRPGTDGGARQDEINRLLVEHGGRGATVVRLKGGDPFLFGRGGEEGEVLTEAAIAWEVVPGVTSAFAVAAAAGIPVTHRGLASSVTVVTGQVGDGTDTSGVDWDTLATLDGTLVILMGMSTRGEIADALQRGGKSPDTPVAVIEKGTMPAQQVVRTTLRGLAAVSLGSPAVIVVGPVAALGDQPSAAPGPLTGRTVVVTRAAPRAKGLVGALADAGARVIELPLTTQAPPSDGGTALRAAAGELASFDWIVFTSANAVDRLLGELRDARSIGATKVAAVGPASGDALRRAGIEPDLVPAEYSARGLVESFPSRPPESAGRVLFPCADLAPTTIPDGLGEKGWSVSRVEAYRTIAVAVHEPELLDEVARADAVTFTATSSVDAYLALRRPDGTPVPMAPLVVCIGPTTAEHARALGVTGVVEAWGASASGMTQVLAHHLAGDGGNAS